MLPCRRALLEAPIPLVPPVPGTWGRLSATPHGEAEIEAEIGRLLARMTLAEKLHQLAGDLPLVRGLWHMARAYGTAPFPAGEDHGRGLPGLRFTDGPRGVTVGSSTAFPVAIARAASFDPALEALVGEAIGVEARAQGANLVGAPCVNVLRHPGWGRAQESYGEDPLLVGELGAAMVRGLQRHVMACAKHLACNSIEDSRMRVDVQIEERVLQEVYLPQFRRCVDEGVAGVMSAYNKLNGVHCGHHRPLLTDLLKGAWGFQGFVMSDFGFGVRGADALAAGVDVEMPLCLYFGLPLRRALARGQVGLHRVEDAATRVLRQKLRFASVGDEPERYRAEAVGDVAHRDLARQAALEGMVLLQNASARSAPLLPLDGRRLQRLALLGPLADADWTGDHGSSRVRPPYVVTAAAGLRLQLGAGKVALDPTLDPRAAARLAAASDAAVLVLGSAAADEGEKMPAFLGGAGGDRRSLALPAAQVALIEAVAAAQPRTVVVLVGGGAWLTPWRDRVPAVLVAWYPGMEGGHALAALLLGEEAPSGKLPMAFPEADADLVPFDPSAAVVRYGPLHGQWHLDGTGRRAAFPFGHGLTYTRFGLSDPAVDPPCAGPADTVAVELSLENLGDRAGTEVVQVYAIRPDDDPTRPLRRLVAFLRVALEPGERRRLSLPLPLRRLARWDEALRRFVVPPGVIELGVGTSSDPAGQLGVGLVVTAPAARSR